MSRASKHIYVKGKTVFIQHKREKANVTHHQIGIIDRTICDTIGMFVLIV